MRVVLENVYRDNCVPGVGGKPDQKCSARLFMENTVRAKQLADN
jgi:hypothetical protein